MTLAQHGGLLLLQSGGFQTHHDLGVGGHDVTRVHVQGAGYRAHQGGHAFGADHLLDHRAVEHDLQELVATDLCRVLGCQCQRPACDDVQIAVDVRITDVTHDKVERALNDGRDDVNVDA